jgi:hypothetical protein
MEPSRLCRACLGVAAAWMLLGWPAMLLWCPQVLPYEMKPSAQQYDFPQYYAGAVVARDGIWDALYPVPKASVYQVPSSFEPQFRTFLFRPPPPASRDPVYYPDIKMGPLNSDVSPRLVSVFPQSAEALRYIYPPPLALLLRPLASLRFEEAGRYVWPILSAWSLFLGLYFAARTMRYLCGGATYGEALVVVAWIVFTIRGRMHLYDGNVSPILTGLICLSIYGLVRGKPIWFCLAFVPLVLFKSLGIPWLGLLLLERRYWRHLLLLAAIVLLVNGVTVAIEGLRVYAVFLALLPKIAVPGGVGIAGTLLHWFGFHAQHLFTLANVACVVLLYYGFWKRLKRTRPQGESADYRFSVLALLAGTMAAYCLFNFNIWIPYCPSYLFYPFLGWMLLEARLAGGGWRKFILASTIVALTALSTEWMVRGCLSHFAGAHAARFYEHNIFPAFCILLIPLFFLIVAFRRLFHPNNEAVQMRQIQAC